MVGKGTEAELRMGAFDSFISTPGCGGCASRTFNSKPLLYALSEFELSDFDAEELDKRE
jgi:hypothetical protein